MMKTIINAKSEYITEKISSAIKINPKKDRVKSSFILEVFQKQQI